MFVLGVVGFAFVLIVILFLLFAKPRKKRPATTVQVPRPRYDTMMGRRRGDRDFD